jgi:PAS domain S-box-containing protein
VFPADQEKTRVAGVLHTVLLATLAGLGAFIILDRSISSGSILRLLIEGVMLLIVPPLLLMMRCGYVRLASVAFTISLWLAATAASVLAGGIRAPALGVYLIVVLSAGILLGWRAALGFAGLSLVADLVLLYATNADILPRFYILTNNAYGADQIIFLLWGTMLLSLARRSVDDALRRMRQELAERRRAEAALARSEQMFKNLVQSINAVVWEADATTFQFSFVSEQAEKLLGYSTADWLARPAFWSDHIHRDDRDAAVSYCVRCTQALEHHEFEYRMLAADGRIVWLRDIVTVEAREGQPQTLRGVMVDITVRKQAEEEVQLLQTASLAISMAPDLHSALSITLQLVSEATGWGLGQAWMPRADGAVIECSAAWWSNTLSLEAFRRHSETTTLPPGVGLPGRVWQSKQTAWLQDVTQEANFPRRAVAQEVGLKAGVAFPVLVGAEVMAVLEFFIVEPRVEDTRLVKLVSTVAAQLGTVIQRKHAEDALRVSESRFRAIFEGAAIGIALVDMNGQSVASNPALRETLGYSAEELHQMRFTQFTHPDDIQTDWGLFEELIAGQRDAYQMEKRYYRKDGALIWARLTASLVRDTDGQPQFVIDMAEDITARKRAEEELRRSAERLHSLHAIDQAILAARSPEAISEAALQRMRNLVPYQWAYVSLFNFAACEMTVLASCGSSATRYPVGMRLPLDILPDAESLIEGLRQGRVRAVEEAGALAPASVENQTLQPDGLRSYILIPLLTQGDLVGSLFLGMEQSGACAPDDIVVAQEVASQLAVAIQQSRLFAQVRAGHERLQSLSRTLIEAQEAERRRIARELHDEIGQALALIKLNIRAVQQMAHTSNLAPRLEQSLGIIEATLLCVRTLALDLRPAMLDDLGLIAALRWYVDQQAHVSDLAVEVHAETNGARLPPEIETVCFRVVQEALANIVRHAHAHQVQVQIERSADAIQLTIQDDGVGFDSEQAWARATQGASGGLLGMHERVALCGGQLRIESAPVSGTTIHVWIPLESPLADMPTTGEEVPDVIDPRSSGG